MGQSLNDYMDSLGSQPQLRERKKKKKNNLRKLMNKRKRNMGQKISRSYTWDHEWWVQVGGVSCR